jgi:TRAP-type C4-dicarboxylate transport system substrate-binding protein
MPTNTVDALASRHGAPWRRLATSFALGCSIFFPASASAEVLQLRVVGGLAGISQYKQLEEPFWTQKIQALSGGRIAATIQPFDRSGLKGQTMLQLIRLGVVPFGTALISVSAAEEPELDAVDLPGLNPRISTLRETVSAFRPRLREILRERFGVELLGVYAYPAQVLFCTTSFSGLSDIRGRRVRVSSAAQSEMVASLGAHPVVTPFSEVVKAIRSNSVDCAITGTLSGYEIGLSDVTSHVHALAINWGLSIFGANLAAWQAIPEESRTIIRSGVAELEREIWERADRDTMLGLACSTGARDCPGERRSRMTVVDTTRNDEEVRRRVLVETVLPRWLDRCGPECAATWNASLSATTGIFLPPQAGHAAGVIAPAAPGN